MDPIYEHGLQVTRRHLLANATRSMGAVALASLMNPASLSAAAIEPKQRGLPGLPHFAGKAKRII